MKSFYISLFVILFNFFMLFSETANKDTNTISLSIDEAVNLALANNLDIKSEKLKFDSSKWAMFTSWNVFVPSVSMSGTINKSLYDDAEDRTTKSTSIISASPLIIKEIDVVQPLYTLSASINMSLNLHLNMGFKIYQSLLDFKSGKLSYEKTKKTIIKEVKKGYYNLILQQENIRLSEESIKIKEKRYNQALINYRNGFKSEFDMLSAQVDYENEKPKLLTLKNDFTKSLLLYKQMIGLKNEANLELISKIESVKKEFDAKELTEKYLNNNLDLKIFKFNLLSLRNSGFMTINALTPTLSLGYSAGASFKKDAKDEIWWSEDSWSVYDSKYVEDNWKVSNYSIYLTLTLPISSFLPFSKEHVDIIKTQYSVEANRIQYQNKLNNLKIEIKSLVNNVSKSKENIEAYKKTLELNERAYQKAEEAYSAGYKDLLDVQNQDNMRNSAKLNLLNAEYQYISNLLDLEYTLNTDLK